MKEAGAETAGVIGLATGWRASRQGLRTLVHAFREAFGIRVDTPFPRMDYGEAIAILDGVEGIRFCRFSDIDVVRHPIVQEIIKAYERFEKRPQG